MYYTRHCGLDPAISKDSGSEAGMTMLYSERKGRHPLLAGCGLSYYNGWSFLPI